MAVDRRIIVMVIGVVVALVANVESPLYEALIVAVPAVAAVKAVVHPAVPAVEVATRVQAVKSPETPETVKITDPVGVLTVPDEESITVAVHVELSLIKTDPFA